MAPFGAVEWNYFFVIAYVIPAPAPREAIAVMAVPTAPPAAKPAEAEAAVAVEARRAEPAPTIAPPMQERTDVEERAAMPEEMSVNIIKLLNSFEIL